MIEFRGFTEKASSALEKAFATAMRLGHTYIGSEHILCGLSSAESGASRYILEKRGLKENDILRKLEATVGKGVPTVLSISDLTPKSRKIIEKALSFASGRCASLAGSEDLLKAICISESCCACKMLKDLGTDT